MPWVRPPPPLGMRDEAASPESSDGQAEGDEADSQPVAGLSTLDLLRPPQHNDIVYGRVERRRAGRLTWLELYNASDDSFVCAAALTSDLGGPIYLHTRRETKGSVDGVAVPKRRGDPAFLGVVAPQSALGTEFALFDDDPLAFAAEAAASTTSPVREVRGLLHSGHGGGDDDNAASLAEQHGQGRWRRPPLDFALIQFKPNVLGSTPNVFTLTVRLSSIWNQGDDDDDGDWRPMPLRERLRQQSQRRKSWDASLWDRAKSATQQQQRPTATAALYSAVNTEEVSDEVASFETKKPEWSAEMGGWTMDFNGRVSLSSKKNCVLIPVDELAFGHDTTILRFGKVAKHRFALDYRYPVSPIVALGVAATLFAKKLVVS